MRVSSSMRRFALPGALAVMAGAAVVLAGTSYFRHRPAKLLLAPMIGLDICLATSAHSTLGAPANGEQAQSCSGPGGSAAALVESTLAALRPPGSNASDYELGYTLNVPLLRLFKERDGDWVIDKELLGRVVRTLRDTERPAILYLFSTHFGQDAPIEPSLAADSSNLSQTPAGLLPKDTFYGADIYNWSLASTRTAISARRVQAAQALLQEICKLEPRHIEKIRGITLLGELHHLYPDYQAGMGFAPPYLVSDYSDVSKAGFRKLLESHFGTIANLNATLGTRLLSFQQIDPPSKDIRSTPLRHFTEHIDSFAHGFLPISGWTYVQEAKNSAPPMLRIYRNGDLIARVPASMGRQDVSEAVPELGSANPGWRFDMDFRNLPAGRYRIDVFLEKKSDDLMLLATRNIAILDKSQQTPARLPQKKLPASRAADPSIKGSVDLPAEQSSYFYNPLVTYWHAFRALQVADYLRSFSQALHPPCLAQTQRYTHQILPFTHPAWDETKFAVDASLRKLDDIDLGVSLYGEPTYGTSFFNWLDSGPHKHYGVTEFHPLRAMDPKELDAMMARHARHGAAFVSFFLEPRWKGSLVPRAHNVFSLDPDNTKYGSNLLYESVHRLLQTDSVSAGL